MPNTGADQETLEVWGVRRNKSRVFLTGGRQEPEECYRIRCVSGCRLADTLPFLRWIELYCCPVDRRRRGRGNFQAHRNEQAPARLCSSGLNIAWLMDFWWLLLVSPLTLPSQSCKFICGGIHTRALLLLLLLLNTQVHHRTMYLGLLA